MYGFSEQCTSSPQAEFKTLVELLARAQDYFSLCIIYVLILRHKKNMHFQLHATFVSRQNCGIQMKMRNSSIQSSLNMNLFASCVHLQQMWL